VSVYPYMAGPRNGTVPPVDTGEMMAYDPLLGALLLFGGCKSPTISPTPCAALNETYTFSGGIWTNVTSSLSASPPAVAFGTLTFDPLEDGVVLTGGQSQSCASVRPWNCTTHRFDGTWVFKNQSWVNITYAVGSGPPAAMLASAAYDPVAQEIIYFGGEWGPGCYPLTPYGMCGETWVLSRGHWQNATSIPAPAPRSGAGMAYDPALGAAILFGGGRGGPMYLNDTWAFSNQRWSLVKLPGTPSPPASPAASMAFDPQSDVVIMTAPMAGTWLFNGSWSEIDAHSLPSWPWVPTVVSYDYSLEEVVAFGGTITPGTWALQGNIWIRL